MDFQKDIPTPAFLSDEGWAVSRRKKWIALFDQYKGRGKKAERFHQAMIGYYMSGTFADPEVLYPGVRGSEGQSYDSTFIDFFPIFTNEGYDYLFRYIVQSPETWQDQVTKVLFGPDFKRFDIDEAVFRFEYFHGSSFEPLLDSKVKVGEKEIVHMKWSSLTVLEGMFILFNSWKYEPDIKLLEFLERVKPYIYSAFNFLKSDFESLDEKQKSTFLQGIGWDAEDLAKIVSSLKNELPEQYLLLQSSYLSSCREKLPSDVEKAIFQHFPESLFE